MKPIPAEIQELFEQMINDMIAPVTRAWTDFNYQITIGPGDIEADRITMTMTLTAKRRTI